MFRLTGALTGGVCLGEQEQFSYYFPRVERGRFNLFHVPFRFVRQGGIFFNELRKSQNASEGLVQFVRHAGRELADGCKAIRVAQLLLHDFLLFPARFCAR